MPFKKEKINDEKKQALIFPVDKMLSFEEEEMKAMKTGEVKPESEGSENGVTGDNC